ncbi:MAG: hypothetical protein L0241_21300 [Planctomycetia bacterium]|nr:hypothetical protein [Planctomycetia bacterium]
MARPKLVIKHFIVCRAAPWEGPPGPHKPRTLEGVCHRIGVPPATEFPFEVEELWSYLRVFNMNAGAATIPFFLTLLWNDAPGRPQRLWTRPYAQIAFRSNRGVVEVAHSIRPVVFPGLGWYEFWLSRELRLRWKTRRLIVAREELLIAR